MAGVWKKNDGQLEECSALDCKELYSTWFLTIASFN